MSQNTDQLDPDEQVPTNVLEEQQYTDLSSEEQERLNEYMNSVSEVEQDRKWRTLFDNAPSATLPFIVYCTYVSANALVATIILITKTQGILPYYLIIAGAMILPLIALPSGSFTNTFSWVRNAVSS
ncbi:hypothetical protein [Halorussus halophilus]|uniref:hypothetical protein n=1 Tax=Halorussus halophilus TaxID=2650975 RepID=UPI0013012E40|nr:hypothetical protein [Halorussus halophilus]